MASFLVVDDNEMVRRSLKCVLHRYGECLTAESATDAEHHITSGKDWDGFVIDVRLGDGSGLDVLATARRVYAETPAVVLSGNLDREAVNRAAVLNARFVCKPCGTEELAPFLSEVLARTTGDRIYATAERARHLWGLSPREVEIVEAMLRGRSRNEYIAATGMSVNTFKTHTRNLLEKTDHENLSRLAIDLLSQRH
jgi:DNA-binding NarL/FixJ family response regulator